MSVVLFRIDDRLVHGQVTVGWIPALAPDLILIVDDAAAASPWEDELICSSCPDQVRARVLPVADGARALREGTLEAKRVLVLVRGTKEARAIVEAGFRPDAINIGGLHHHPGAQELLPFIRVDAGERSDLAALAALGIPLEARALPLDRPVDLKPLLAGDAG